MIIRECFGACPVEFLAVGIVALALSSSGCSLLEGDPAEEAAAATAPAAATPALITKPLISYKVEKGDSLWELARDFKTSIQEIRDANNLEGDLLRAGDTIMIPTDHAEGRAVNETEEAAVGTTTSPATEPVSVTPGVGTQPIADAPATPPSRTSSPPAKRSSPPIISEELQSENIRYFSTPSEPDSW